MPFSELRLSALDRPGRRDEPLSSTVTVFRSFDADVVVRVVARAGHSRAAVSGEIDLAAAPIVGGILAGCMDRSPGGLQVDLADVRFFDCAGLNVLLRLRKRAEDQEYALTVSALGLAVTRVLDITGTRELFLPGPTAEPTPRTVRSVRNSGQDLTPDLTAADGGL